MNLIHSRGHRGLEFAIALGVAVGSVFVFNSFDGGPPFGIAVLLAVLPPVVCIVLGTRELHRIRAVEGVEQLLLTETSALAFWVTIWSALIYFWLEAAVRAPNVSMGFVFAYGMVVRMLLTVVASRRLR